MQYTEHLRTAGGALKRWFVATLYDAAAVAAMWLVGLLIVGVPWAPAWALLGGLFQFVPNFGPILALVGPSLALLLAPAFGVPFDGMKFIYLLIVYAIIIIVDGLVLQPYLMKRSNRVPVWASIITPIILGIVIPFWGVLLAPPLLAVVFAFRSRSRAIEKRIEQVQKFRERFPVGTRVRVKDQDFLRVFQQEWRRLYPIQPFQIAAAGQTDVIRRVGFSERGDVLYELAEHAGIWHERCLEEFPNGGIAELRTLKN